MVLLLIVAIPLFYSAGFLITQKLVKGQMEEKLEKSALQTVVVPVKEVRWLNGKKEIIVQGKLFDVKSFSIANETLIATGLFDEDEDKLHEKLKGFLERSSNDASPLNNLIVAFFSTPINTIPAGFTATPDWHYITRSYCSYAEKVPTPPFLSEILPPKL